MVERAETFQLSFDLTEAFTQRPEPTRERRNSFREPPVLGFREFKGGFAAGQGEVERLQLPGKRGLLPGQRA